MSYFATRRSRRFFQVHWMYPAIHALVTSFFSNCENQNMSKAIAAQEMGASHCQLGHLDPENIRIANTLSYRGRPTSLTRGIYLRRTLCYRGLRILYLAFGSKQLREICEYEQCASEKLGIEVSDSLKERLADLMAAQSPRDLVAGSPRSIRCRNHEFMVVDLCQGCQVTFVANHPVNPVDDSGAIEWSRVSRVRIINVGPSGE